MLLNIEIFFQFTRNWKGFKSCDIDERLTGCKLQLSKNQDFTLAVLYFFPISAFNLLNFLNIKKR